MKIVNLGGARAALFPYEGKDYYLLFNVPVLLAIEDEYGPAYVDTLNVKTEEGIRLMLRLVSLMSEQGELARREIGLDAREIKPLSESLTLLQPAQRTELFNACITAHNIGNLRELADEDEEVDLGLIELQKKRKK